jgi:methylamine--corrinoid protein Co-methyltransferase
MIPLFDFQRRSLTGPVMKTDDFDIGFSMKLRELVKKHKIEYKPEELIVDDETADAIFHAAVELLAEIGLYNLSTLRVVQYSQEEIFAFAEERKQNPGKAVFGLGEDEMTIAFRKGSDPRPPTLYIGIAGAIEEEEFVPLATAFTREKKIKGMGISGGICKVGDIEPRAGTLSEIHCALWEQQKLQEVLESVGRPGMNLGLLCTASTVAGTMQVIESSFRGPHNTQIGVHVLPEQKIDWDRLLLANFCQSKGIVPWQSAMTLIGGLCRNGADGAVSLVASMLAHMSYAHGPMCSVFPTNIDGSWGTRPTIWAAAAAMRASERNIRLATGSGTVGSYSWAGTHVGVLQSAAMALVYTASGFSYSWLSASPLEVLLMDEIMSIATKMEREAVQELANIILTKIDALQETEAPRQEMLKFKDIYDLETIQPRPEHQQMLDQAKEDLIKLGVPLAR